MTFIIFVLFCIGSCNSNQFRVVLITRIILMFIGGGSAMTTRKVGRPRTDSVKLQLALPKHLGDWVDQRYKNTKYCRSRQDFIIGILEDTLRKEEGLEQLELGV